MKKVLAAIYIFLFTFSVAAKEPCSDMVYGGEFPRAQAEVVILCKKEFVVGYSTTKKVPLWAAYVIDPEKITKPNAVGSLRFSTDPSLPRELQASLNDYVNSGFDRGHVVPLEDVNHDLTAAIESMMLTNIIPQYPASNRGIWRVLETKVRNQALSGRLFIIVGPVFEASALVIGKNKVPVPTKLYRVVINPRNKTSTSYVIPHLSTPIASSKLPKFITTRDRVKELTGIELIPAIVLSETK